MADQANQATLDVNKIFAGVGKEGRPVSVATNEALVTEKTAADLTIEAEEIQAQNQAKQQAIDNQGLAEAREIISDLSKEKIETDVADETNPPTDLVDIEAIATKEPEKLINGVDNTAEVVAFGQETQALYQEKAAKAAATLVATEETTADINELVINGIKQNADAEKIVQENLGKNPEQALTWRAWLSEKLRKMWRIFAKQEKN